MSDLQQIRICPTCNKEYKKPYNCSKKSWQMDYKVCSKKCYKPKSESIEKMRLKRIGQFAKDKHPNWKGGENKRGWYERQRQLRKLNNGGTHTYKEWNTLKMQYNFQCPCCEMKEPIIKLTEDHIIPISKNGSNSIKNIQPLCKSCNSRKNNKTIKY